MDYKIVWSDHSLIQLKEVLQFIADKNPSAALSVGKMITDKVLLLSRFPHFGKVFAKLERDDVREVSVPPYRIIYQVLDREKIISILAIWHGARQEPELS